MFKNISTGERLELLIKVKKKKNDIGTTDISHIRLYLIMPIPKLI